MKIERSKQSGDQGVRFKDGLLLLPKNLLFAEEEQLITERDLGARQQHEMGFNIACGVGSIRKKEKPRTEIRLGERRSRGEQLGRLEARAECG